MVASMRLCGGRLVVFGLISLLLCAAATRSLAQQEQNRITSITVDAEAARKTVNIRTQNPVGYRYTVYDSIDPVRIVVEFPGMDVSGIAEAIRTDAAPLQEIRVSSLELTSGDLARIELLLANAVDYNIGLDGETFTVALAAEPEATESVAVAPVTPSPAEPSMPVATPAAAAATEAEDVAVSAVPSAEAPTVATRIEAVEVREAGASLVADGQIGTYRHFTLGAPPRLVVDVYGVKPGFSERAFPAVAGFSSIRVGTYDDKTRFVFDAEEEMPGHAVSEEGNSIAVSWSGDATVSAPTSPPPGAPVTVEGVDFWTEDGKSILAVDLSGPFEVIDAEAEGDLVRFGIRNARISRPLRRSIDASGFPSAVELATPYIVRGENASDVRFAVQLKGPVPYSLQREGDRVLFSVEDGPFAEPAPVFVEEVPVPLAAAPAAPAPAMEPAADEQVTPATAMSAPPLEETVPVAAAADAADVRGPAYSGEKITLVFDDADIRRIFQLIGEVSNLNILVGDEVKGTITLRLVDVPWDQALALILDTKNLGMLRDGNVARILPKDQIRAMRQAELTAVQQERDLEPLTTEVISVSYTDLGNITGPAGELLTDRGKITPDNRNKQLIVTDIPAVIEEVKRLVAILDTPEKQVMIEARIVEANTSFTRDLGVSWNFQYVGDDVDDVSDLSGAGVSGGGNFIINPAVGAAGLGTSFTFGDLEFSSSVLDLRIAAAETAGNSKVISKPRVTTLNGEGAVISQGTQIPYQSVSDQGTKTEFVDATLELDVTPIINPDDSIILEIKASNNTPTTVAGASAPGIDKKEAETKVLVKNGETTVIGGIYTENDANSETGIPWLRKLPVLGHLFKSTNRSNDRRELLIFITPHILD